MHIKLKDQQWAAVVEEHFGGFFGAFIVANMAGRGRCRLTPGFHSSPCAWLYRLKLKHVKPLSNVAFNFNLRHYNMADRAKLDKMMREAGTPPNIHVTNFGLAKVGRCKLTPG